MSFLRTSSSSFGRNRLSHFLTLLERTIFPTARPARTIATMSTKPTDSSGQSTNLRKDLAALTSSRREELAKAGFDEARLLALAATLGEGDAATRRDVRNRDRRGGDGSARRGAPPFAGTGLDGREASRVDWRRRAPQRGARFLRDGRRDGDAHGGRREGARRSRRRKDLPRPPPRREPHGERARRAPCSALAHGERRHRRAHARSTEEGRCTSRTCRRSCRT